MKKESHPLAGEWLDEDVSKVDNDNIEQADAFAKPESDHPLTFQIKVEATRIARLGLAEPRSKPLLVVRNAIIADTMVAHAKGQWVSYSRNNNFYAREA